MKKLILLFVFALIMKELHPQIVTIANETFENPLSGWTIIPSASWEADTNLYAGGNTSYCGYVPIGNQGDTVVITSPLYDFSGYGYAFLSFNQICKVLASDICRIEYCENTMSSSWQAIPRSSYSGVIKILFSLLSFYVFQSFSISPASLLVGYFIYFPNTHLFI